MKTSKCFEVVPFKPCPVCEHERKLYDYDDDVVIVCVTPRCQCTACREELSWPGFGLTAEP